jgi:hypothetical protein
MNFIITLNLILLFFNPVQKENTINLQNEKLLTLYFSTQEIHELENTMVDFEACIFGKSNYKFDKDVYLDYFEESRKCKTGDGYIKQLKIMFPKTDKTVLKNCSQSLINKIWDNDENRYFVSLKYKGEFFYFLNDYSTQKNDSVLKQYFTSWEIAGDIGPANIGWIAKELNSFNLDDRIVRLLLSIHFISLSNTE